MKLVLVILSIMGLNQEPLPGAKVELIGTDKVYYTNLKGQVTIPNNFDVKVSYISYQTKIVSKNNIQQPIILISR